MAGAVAEFEACWLVGNSTARFNIADWESLDHRLPHPVRSPAEGRGNSKTPLKQPFTGLLVATSGTGSEGRRTPPDDTSGTVYGARILYLTVVVNHSYKNACDDSRVEKDLADTFVVARKSAVETPLSQATVGMRRRYRPGFVSSQGLARPVLTSLIADPPTPARLS